MVWDNPDDYRAAIERWTLYLADHPWIPFQVFVLAEEAGNIEEIEIPPASPYQDERWLTLDNAPMQDRIESYLGEIESFLASEAA